MDPEKLDLKRAVAPEKDAKVYIVFSVIWTLGANLHDDYRKTFSRFMKDQIIKID
jgi:hypothetical protein